MIIVEKRGKFMGWARQQPASLASHEEEGELVVDWLEKKVWEILSCARDGHLAGLKWVAFVWSLSWGLDS